MNILLVAVNAKYIHSNLAVYCLKAYAKEFKEDIVIAEYTINQQVDDILMDIYKRKPDILCFSCYLWNIQYIEELIVEIGKILPETVIWLGGPEVSYNGAKVLEKFPEVTGVMVGEGEETFLELLRYYEGPERKLPEEVAGTIFRNSGGAIVAGTARHTLDLSSVPFVYTQMDDFDHRIIYYETSRGCPFSCSYCLSSIDKCLRFRNLEMVKEELQFFIDHEVPQVKFVDRTFNCRHDHAMAVWTYIKEHDKGKTNFHFEVAADLLSDEELELIASMRPGLIQLEIGIQSTNEQTIQEIRRTMKFDQAAKVVRHINAGNNVHQHLDLIAGLPYEDYESFAKSFDDVYGLRPEQLQLGFLKVLKGSYMHDHASEYELKYQSRPPFEVLSTKWISYEDIIRLKGVEEMVEVYYNSGQFTNTLNVLEERFPSPFALYEALRVYYEKNNLNTVSHSRVARYEILFAFAVRHDGERKEMYRELLTYDLYLRDNMKSRPSFAGEQTVSKEEMAAFYEREAKEHRYLKGYEQYDKRQLRKMTHLERVKGEIVLFDYLNRSPLTNQAAACAILVQV